MGLSPQQKKRFDSMRRNQGPEAAAEFRRGILQGGGGQTPAPTTREVPGQTSTPTLRGKKKKPGAGSSGQQLLDKANQNVQGIITSGEAAGKQIAPELFNNPEALGRFTDKYAGQTGQLVNNAMNFQQNAANVSPEMQRIIQQREAELGGFSTPEQEALKMQATQGMDADLNSAMRRIGGSNAARNLQGGLASRAMSPAMNAFANASGNLRANILQQEMAERARRLSEFQGAVQQRDTDVYNRGVGGFQTAQGVLNPAREFDAAGQQFNMGQLAKEIAGRTAARGTGIGLTQDEVAGEQGREDFNRLLKHQRRMQKQLMQYA